MALVHKLKYNKGSITKSKPRRGRGNGSRLGNTSGKGPEGQTKRAGASIGNVFQGGQTVLVKGLPLLRGTRNSKKASVNYMTINLKDLPRNQKSIDTRLLLKLKSGLKVKVLSNGDAPENAEILAHSFSESAKRKIEEKGSTAKIIE